MRTLLVIIFVALYLLLGLPVLFVEWLAGKKNPQRADLHQLRMVQWAFKVILFLSGTDLTVIGEENVPKDEAVLYVGNHRSYFDIIISYSRCPRLTGYIAKDGMLKLRLISLWMKRLHCLFIDRDDIKQSLKTILAGIEQIKNGISVCIYPEGTRSESESETDLLPFKEGSFKMAEKTGCRIVPMAMTGSRDIFEAHLPWIRRKHVILEYGKPICIDELSAADKKKVGEYCRNEILEMLKAHQTLSR